LVHLPPQCTSKFAKRREREREREKEREKERKREVINLVSLTRPKSDNFEEEVSWEGN
jgi:hypothetical protein